MQSHQKAVQGKHLVGREVLSQQCFGCTLPVVLHAWATSDVWVAWIATLASAITSSSLEASGFFRCGMSVIACNPHVFNL